MEATKQQIASIFNGHRILDVPFYQRSYVWHKEQWSRFLEEPFYHRNNDGKDNYLDIVQNISRDFTDMKLMRDRVVNKEYCNPLPQSRFTNHSSMKTLT